MSLFSTQSSINKQVFHNPFSNDKTFQQYKLKELADEKINKNENKRINLFWEG